MMDQSNFLQILPEIENSLPDIFFEKLFEHPVLSQSFLEFPYAPPPELIQKINDVISRLSFQFYPKTETGEVEKLLASSFHLNTEEKVIVGNGGFYLLNLLIKMMLLKKEPRILLLSPDFFYFKHVCSQFNVVITEFVYSNFDIHVDELCQTIKDFHPDLVLMSNPNNPSGKALDTDSIRRIISASTGLVVIDEVYADFAAQTMIPLVSTCDNLLILRSFSKIGFAAIRFGYFYGNKYVIKTLKKLREPFSINLFTLEIAKLVIQNFNLIQQNIDDFILIRDQMHSELEKISLIHVIPSSSNFIVVGLDKKIPALDLYHQLVSMKVVVRHYSKPSQTENYLRLSVFNAETNQRVVKCLSDIIDRIYSQSVIT